MLWRAGDALVVLHEGAYVCIDASDGVTPYGTRAYSDEDDLWVWAPVVEGDRLLVRTTIAHGAEPPRLHEDREILRGLVPDESKASRQRAAAALAAAARAEAARAEAIAKAADARVAAIERAFDGPDFTGALGRAHAALRERVRRWDDARAKELLGTLAVVGRANVGIEVTTAFARGCLLACFQHDVPDLPAAPSIVDHAALAAKIADHAAALARDSDDQEAVDAHGNAAAYSGAARALREAARWLGANLPG